MYFDQTRVYTRDLSKCEFLGAMILSARLREKANNRPFYSEFFIEA